MRKVYEMSVKGRGVRKRGKEEGIGVKEEG
jgi:hypothetical protein